MQPPETLSCDFELAITNAAVAVWPQVRISYCFFHFTQNLWRKIQELGFAKSYNTDQKVRMFFRSFAVMAFLPVEDVLDNGQDLALDWLKEKYPVVKYFEDTYIGEKKRGRGAGSRKEPLFAVAAWNVHKRTLTGLSRTSNNIEGWHHGVNYSVLKQKQNHLLSVIDGLKLE
jgi:hypothetical protein